MIDYYLFKSKPLCKECTLPLISDAVWKRYVKKNKSIYGDNGAIRGRKIGEKIYWRIICSDCFELKTGKKLPKFNMVSWDFEILADVPKNILEKYFETDRKVTLENMILKYGEIEGNLRWENYIEKQKYTNSKEYHFEKFNRTEEEWIVYNASRKVTLENMILKYGETEGNLRWENYIEKQKYSETLEYYIEKYGEEEGNIKFIDHNSRKSNTLENMILRYGVTEGNYRYTKLMDNQKSGYSKMASDFFKELEEYILKDFTNINPDKIYYLPKNKEYCIYDTKGYYYDFTITDNINLCIEFFGNCFHANPNIYKPNDKPIYFYNCDLTANQIWEKDKEKLNKIVLRNFITYVVWEEYLKTDNFIKTFYMYTIKPKLVELGGVLIC